MTDQRIGVLHLVGGADIGGINTYVSDLFRAIDHSRFRLGVWSFEAEAAGFAEFRDLGAEVMTLGSLEGYGAKGLWKYMRHIRSRRYRVLHAHVGSRAPRVAARLAGCRTIAHAHGYPESWISRMGRSDPAMRPILKRAFEFASDSVIACSKRVGLVLEQDCPSLRAKLRVITSSFDARRSRPLTTESRAARNVSLGLPGDAVVVGFAGRLVGVKRVDRLIDAAQCLVRQHSKAYFLVAGEGELRPELERRAAPLGDRFRFLGHRAASDWPGLFDLLVLPSDSEGLPLCILEAMAAGIPVVATRVGGIEEAVEDGVSGLLVHPGDSPALAKAISRFLDSSDVRLKAGSEGRARVKACFDPRDMARRVEDLYAELAQSVPKLDPVAK